MLRRGIEEGRTTFANTLKYIFITTSANFGNMVSMAGASLFLPFLPLLPKQILLNNFLSDIPADGASPTDNVDPEWVDRPRRWDVQVHPQLHGGVRPGQLGVRLPHLRDAALHRSSAAEPEFRTGWFLESLLTELVIAAHRPHAPTPVPEQAGPRSLEQHAVGRRGDAAPPVLAVYRAALWLRTPGRIDHGAAQCHHAPLHGGQ